MDRRIARALATGTVLVLPLLTACGADSASDGSATPAASSAAAPATPATSAAATPSTSTPTSDDTAAVRTATETFVEQAFTLGYPDRTTEDWADRVQPLMTKRGYEKLRGEVTVEETLTSLRSQFGDDVRTRPKLRREVEVSRLEAARATVDITFESRLQQRSGDTWKTLRKSPESNATLALVKQGERWLVDDAG